MLGLFIYTFVYTFVFGWVGMYVHVCGVQRRISGVPRSSAPCPPPPLFFSDIRAPSGPGTPGLGKTSWAASLKKLPVFLPPLQC